MFWHSASRFETMEIARHVISWIVSFQASCFGRLRDAPPLAQSLFSLPPSAFLITKLPFVRRLKPGVVDLTRSNMHNFRIGATKVELNQ